MAKASPTAARTRRVFSLKIELVTKAREAALAAIKIFNDPLMQFKSEAFIVLMVIAWTYMLHAHFRAKRIEYRYFHQGPKRRKFDRTKKGAFKFWELERCLNEPSCPLDRDTENNLRFLIGLRNEIEHQMTLALDDFLSGRYQACALNFNDYLKQLFGEKYGLDRNLSYSLQFIQLQEAQFASPKKSANVPKRILGYITEFDASLNHEEYNSPRFSYRLLFKKKLVNRPGQADRVVEFIDPSSELAKTIDKEYWVKKEVERDKFRPKDVVAEVKKAGFPGFRMFPHHVDFWKQENAKDPAKGYGTNVQGSWYWYENWVKRCVELCEAGGDRFR